LPVNNTAAFLKRIDAAFKIHGVPKRDGGDNQIYAAGSMLPVLVGAVAQFPQTVKEHRSSQRIASLPFGQVSVDALSQLDVLDAVQQE
jgi:hypothetical protein